MESKVKVDYVCSNCKELTTFEHLYSTTFKNKICEKCNDGILERVKDETIDKNTPFIGHGIEKKEREIRWLHEKVEKQQNIAKKIGIF